MASDAKFQVGQNVRLIGTDKVGTINKVIEKDSGFGYKITIEGKTNAYAEKYLEAFKKPPAYGGHYTYDSMYVLSAALQKAKSAKPKDVTAAMHSINGYAPVTGTMTWDDKGEQRYAAVGVYELRRGNWELRMRSDRW